MTYSDWRERLGQALDPRFYRLEHLDEMVSSGRARVLADQHAAIVIEAKTFPTGTVVVNGLVAAGDLDAIKALIGVAEQIGRQAGCAGALIESRDGWAKALKPLGYEVFQVSIFKEL